MSTTPTPPNGMVSNTELILRKILGEDVTPLPPNSRVEYYLWLVKELIATLQSAVNLKGETTTPLTDNATTNPIMIDGQSYTAVMNDAVIYQSGEFIFDGTKWHELGDLSNLTSLNIGAMTGYSKPSETSAIAIADTLNEAIGKLEKALDLKQSTIDSTHKLSADNVDDTSTTNKFATAAELEQIETNKNNILYINDEINGRQFSFTNGASIMTDVSVGDIIDTTPTSSVSWAYTIVPVVYGETIIITGQGGNSARLWAFADNEYRLVSKSIGNNTLSGADISVPLGASYCIINSTISSLGFCGIIGFKEDIYNLKKFRPIENLVDKNDADMIIGGYIDTNGARQTNASLDQSGYIPVISGEYYTSTQNNTFVLWYDENKTLIGNTPAADVNNNGTCKAISGASYGRWITTVANYATWKVARGKYLDNSGVAFGTSLTYRAQTTGGYLQYLPDLIGEPIENHGIGNATILTSETTPQLNILSEIKSYTDYTKKNFCIIEGFVNDWVQHADKLGTYTDTAETTVCGCVRSAINYILTQNPDINLLLILDHVGTGVNASTYKFNNLTQFEFYNEIAKVAESMSVPVCKGYELSQMNEYSADYFIDNIHPTDKGASHFAYVINDNYKNIAIKQ